ncbi:hypothetical protein ACFOY8_24005 [Thalassospira xianhensis]|uniref:Uncharacterized protein n=1 Tax=Thalassospira xianhensis MCCC 1A02616 TaxID=1177929 RepID=A0A367U9X8_9PROT|nr:hypothetical protein [Thalassospira xianhensis]RCK04760.1 hypothetical protein TH5_17780 [Thalassospira xianhensis MCCC 1A02616]
MDKIGDWLNSVPLVGIASASFAVGILYGKGLPCVEWETLIAGGLGLTGGSFAYYAARVQLRTNERNNTFAAKVIARQHTLKIGEQLRFAIRLDEYPDIYVPYCNSLTKDVERLIEAVTNKGPFESKLANAIANLADANSAWISATTFFDNGSEDPAEMQEEPRYSFKEVKQKTSEIEKAMDGLYAVIY